MRQFKFLVLRKFWVFSNFTRTLALTGLKKVLQWCVWSRFPFFKSLAKSYCTKYNTPWCKLVMKSVSCLQGIAILGDILSLVSHPREYWSDKFWWFVSRTSCHGTSSSAYMYIYLYNLFVSCFAFLFCKNGSLKSFKFLWSYFPAKWLSYNSNWITLLLLCTSAALVLCCDLFNHGSRQLKRDPVDLVMDDHHIPLCWQVDKTFRFPLVGIFKVVQAEKLSYTWLEESYTWKKPFRILTMLQYVFFFSKIFL